MIKFSMSTEAYEQHLRELHERLGMEREKQCGICGKPATHDVEGEKFCHYCYRQLNCQICRVQVTTLDTYMGKPIHPTCFNYHIVRKGK